MTLQKLSNSDFFSRADYISALKEEIGTESEEALTYRLREDTAKGRIIHIGRDQYAFPSNKQTYSHPYSDEAQGLATEIQSEYSDALFQIFELTQLNSFVNHLYAHNTIFVSVENQLIDYVFDSLRRNHPGRIMLKPSPDHYFRYLVEDQIVIQRLPSESPKNDAIPWQSRLEKILVDISVDKLLTQIVSPGEYDSIFQESFDRYYLDINTMYRYARRRGALEKFREIYQKYAPAGTEG